jgi:TetR/AcrR family transcriptional repressor of nem operon
MGPAPERVRSDTRAAILDTAEKLVQTRGFNGFSYADVSSTLGVTNAALHYHFPGKAELGHALITRYADRFMGSLHAIEGGGAPPVAQLRAYTELYGSVLEADRMCLCGMLAAEYQTLPEAMQQDVVAFFDANHDWLARVLEEGRADGTLRFAGRAGDVADLTVGTLEGALLVARTYGDTGRFKAVAELCQELFGAAGSGVSRAR